MMSAAAYHHTSWGSRDDNSEVAHLLSTSRASCVFTDMQPEGFMVTEMQTDDH